MFLTVLITVLGLIFCLMVVGFACKHLRTGKIYVGYGEGIIYGRTWVTRDQDPLFFWAIVVSLFSVSGFFFFSC